MVVTIKKDFTELEICFLWGMFYGMIHRMADCTEYDACVKLFESLDKAIKKTITKVQYDELIESTDKLLKEQKDLMDQSDFSSAVKKVIPKLYMANDDLLDPKCSICDRWIQEEAHYCEISDCPHKEELS